MQKLVKKNIEKNYNKPTILAGTKDVSKSVKTKKVEKLGKLKRDRLTSSKFKSNVKSKFKQHKSLKLKQKHSKMYRLNKRILANSVAGRPFQKYQIKRKSKLHRLNFRIAPNNAFCSLKDTATNTMIRSVSGGSYKLKISKKGIRYSSLLVANSFFKDLRDRKVQFNKPLIVKITAPSTLKKPVLEVFKNSCFKKLPKKKFLFLEVTSNKVFNGCRPRKKTRKKRQGLRLFK